MELSVLRKGFNDSRVILAFDGLTVGQARKHAEDFCQYAAGGKANDLIDQVGVESLASMPMMLRFYDPKLNDIRQTVVNRLLAYKTHADIVTVHASMNPETLRAAAKVAETCGFACVGVTVLTDMTHDECIDTFGRTPEEAVRHFTIRARDAGLQGIVCSPRETAMVRNLFPEALIINPGVRLEGSNMHDQARVDTPGKAIRNGADLLVCGREILGQQDKDERLAMLLRINTDVNNALLALA